RWRIWSSISSRCSGEARSLSVFAVRLPCPPANPRPRPSPRAGRFLMGPRDQRRRRTMQLVPHRGTLYGVAALMGLAATRSTGARTAPPTQLPAASAVTEVAAVHRTAKNAKAPNLSAEAVWVPGFWDSRDNPQKAPRAGWVWVPGRWLEPPVPGAEWDAGHWD